MYFEWRMIFRKIKEDNFFSIVPNNVSSKQTETWTEGGQK